MQSWPNEGNDSFPCPCHKRDGGSRVIAPLILNFCARCGLNRGIIP
jgi:hypothetical protein